ncbi:regulatory protein GemA [Mameliella alba]|uniref:Mu-like prophage protein gp16 n=1 Tax=Mameliella alba TaxID=561184 RepID=A0A0B3RPD4_9RHOB|nr:regulatory protein GemA [Mameliella alba]KHQ53000.1 Mu-like prophage protein gp16 [Mameliella alba]
MTISENQRKLFWVAVKKLDIPDRGVRDILTEIAGVESASDLDNDGFSAVMGFFEYCGFKPLTSKGKDYGERPGMASYRQIAFIRTLWVEYTRRKAGEDELNRWLLNKWHISSLRFLTAEMAPKLITALKAMKARAA